MHHNLNLNWLRSFEAAARLLSFTAASREIGLTQTAVSQHIKALETQLGDKLFLRRPKSLHLTDVGKAYLLTVREALDTIEMSTTGLFGPRQARTITSTSSLTRSRCSTTRFRPTWVNGQVMSANTSTTVVIDRFSPIAPVRAMLTRVAVLPRC